MKGIPLKEFSSEDQTGLMELFQLAQKEAAQKGEAQLVSVSIKVPFIFPLAVLESIYDENEMHFYMEKPSEKKAIACADAVLSFNAQGENRFKEISDFIQNTLANTIVSGAWGHAFCGPHFFCAFNFSNHPSGNRHPGNIFVPRWQVSQLENEYSAVANVLISEKSNLEMEVMRIWKAHEKFEKFSYEDVHFNEKSHEIQKVAGDEDAFAKAIEFAKESLGKQDLEKVVLAREEKYQSDKDFSPMLSLNTLRGRFPDCYTISYSDGSPGVFIGATPERLASIKNGVLNTEALAGTAARGRSAGEDASYSRGLLSSQKDRAEHEFVVAQILSNLRELGLQPEKGECGLLALKNVMHLKTPITAKVGSSVDLIRIVETLHPTPAVAGVPREKAIDELLSLENFNRGLYTGLLGWVNCYGEGDMVVNLRCAELEGKEARLFAGAGIVSASDVEAEVNEVRLKLKAVLSCLS